VFRCQGDRSNASGKQFQLIEKPAYAGFFIGFVARTPHT
jgi:hypothetical protein